MKSITIHISELEFDRLGFTSDEVNYTELVKKIAANLASDALRKCQGIAHESGLSDLTMEEIDAEINAVRNAKDHS